LVSKRIDIRKEIGKRMIKKLEILLVEDNLIDVEFIRETLNALKINYSLHIIDNGEDAMNFLYKLGPYITVPSPDFIILDLNLPKKDGREVLIEIKHHDDFKLIPVVILTSSRDANDIKMVYDNYANCYLTKPINIIKFKKTIKSLKKFWLSIDKVQKVKSDIQ